MPLKELERLKAVNRYLKLEIRREKELQKILSSAAAICGVPTALITLIDEDTQHIRFKVGFDRTSTSRQEAFCNYVIEQAEVMIIPDARLDNRFCSNPLVTGKPSIRFYAGAPLTTSDGYNLGSLCVIDQNPHHLSELQQIMLETLSHQIIQLLEFENSISILKEQFIQAKKAEIELRSFFDSSIDCHLLLGKDFELLAFNRSAEKLITQARGLTLTRGNQLGPYLHPEVREVFYLNYIKALKGTAAFEQRKLGYEDRDIHWLIKYEPAFNQAGEIIGVSVNSTDISMRVAQEAKLANQSASLDEIAFIQSHELRKPVASIMGLMNLLKDDSRCNYIEELVLMKSAVAELDEKIRLVVNHSSSKR